MSCSREPDTVLWTSADVARYCRCRPATVNRWRSTGKLSAAGRTPGGRWLYEPAEVRIMLQEEATPTEMELDVAAMIAAAKTRRPR